MPRGLKSVLVLLAILGACAFLVYSIFKPELLRADFEKHLKQRVRPEELQAWATKVLQKEDTHKLYDYGTVTNLHPAFRGLFINPPSAWWYSASPPDTAFLRVAYGGGGGGHWGVEIGPTNRPMPESTDGRRYTWWAPGVFFFTGQ